MNYDTVEQRLAKRLAFKHGRSMQASVEGYWCGVCNQPRPTYAVFSYDTLIFSECTECGTQWFNNGHYSQTTSRQQNIVKRAVRE